MTQMSPQPSTPHPPASEASNPNALDQQGDDALSHLYKMSRTAGLGSQDYVAINPVAVTAIIFGLASALVVVDPLLIIVPIVGLVLGIIAVRQIRGSNGTQTGGAIAGIALLLSLGFLGFKAAGSTLQSMRTAADKQQINGLIDSIGKDLGHLTPDTLADAYSKFGTRFTTRVPRERFDALWLGMTRSEYYGLLKSFHSNGQLKLETDAISGDNMAVGIVVAEFERGEAPRWQMNFRQTGGKWVVEDLPEVFPVAPPTPPSRGR